MSTATITRQLQVSGQLRGLCYCWNMAQLARFLGVQGWVSKQEDGKVDAIVSGPTSKVETLIQWAHVGPLGARIDEVSVSDFAELVGEIGEFQQR
jgi:acylphosphatase